MAAKFSVDAIFRAIDQISNPMTRMAARVSRAAGRMEKSLGKTNRMLARIGSGARTAGAAVVAAGAIGAVALTKVIGVGAEFEQVLVNAGSKFEEPIKRGTAAFAELEKAALDVSSTTEFGAIESGKALNFMAKAGETAFVAMGSLRTFADLATVAETDLATAADFASDAIGPLGLATDDLSKKSAAYARTADLMAKTTNIANVGFEDLFESIKAGAGAFIGAGQDVEQFLASVALIAGAGIKGSKGGKDLARAMTRITDEATKAPKALKRFGIAVDDGQGGIRDFLDIMTDLEVQLKKVSEVKRAQAIADIFGANSKAAGIAILANLDKARRFEDKLNNVSGFTAELAATSRGTALASIKTFWSTIESVVVGVFAIIRDDVDRIAKSMTKWANANKEAFGDKIRKGVEFIRENFDGFVKVAPRLAKLTIAILAVAKALAIVEVVMGIVALTTGAAAISFGLVAISVFALIAALVILVVFWDEIVAGIEKVHSVLVDLGVDAIDVVVAAWEGFVEAMGKFGGMLVDIMVDAFATMAEAWESPMATLKAFPGDIMQIWKALPGFFSDLWDGVVDTFESKIRQVGELIDDFKNLFGSDEIEVKVRPENLPPPPRVAPSVRGVSLFEPATFEPPEETGPIASFEPPEFLAEVPREFATFGDESANDIRSLDPQVISTTSLEIARSVSETLQRQQVEITLRDPAGVVESISEKSPSGNIAITSSGAL